MLDAVLKLQRNYRKRLAIKLANEKRQEKFRK